MRRGAGDLDTARRIMNNCLVLEVVTGAALMAIFYGFMRPILFAFGASPSTWPYAQAYLQIYLLGTVFNMVSLGMNSFVNAQGFGRRMLHSGAPPCPYKLVNAVISIMIGKVSPTPVSAKEPTPGKRPR